MRIATFNIHHGTVGKDGEVDPQQLGRVCAGFDADVLALEEVDQGTIRTGGADLAAEVARACGMRHVFGPARRYPGGWYGNAVLVRGEIHAWSVLDLPRVPRWKRWQEHRSAVEVHATVAGRAIRIVATHLAVPKAVNGPQLDHLLRTVTARPGPLVVLGDFNRVPAGVEAAATAAGLTFVHHGPTSPVEPRRRLSIDHVLLSAGLVRVAAEVRATAMSDHAALLVDVEPVDGVSRPGGAPADRATRRDPA